MLFLWCKHLDGGWPVWYFTLGGIRRFLAAFSDRTGVRQEVLHLPRLGEELPNQPNTRVSTAVMRMGKAPARCFIDCPPDAGAELNLSTWLAEPAPPRPALHFQSALP